MRINNKFLNLIFNNFDAPIRFFYCKTGIISKAMNSMMFWKFYSSNFYKINQVFEKNYLILQKNKIDLKDKIILELGPGNSLTNAYNFLMSGAKKVILVDKFSRQVKTKRQKDFCNKEIEFIKNKYKRKKLFFLDKNNNVKQEFIQFINKDLTKISNLKVDFIYSVSVLEHIKYIKNNIEKMSEILGDNGCMYHNIDIRDHYNFNNPFLFYKYSDYIWNKFLTKEGLSYTNRWRYDDFVKCFNKNNFRIIKEEKKRYKLNGVKINEKLKNYKNLDIGALSIILQK